MTTPEGSKNRLWWIITAAIAVALLAPYFGLHFGTRAPELEQPEEKTKPVPPRIKVEEKNDVAEIAPADEPEVKNADEVQPTAKAHGGALADIEDLLKK